MVSIIILSFNTRNLLNSCLHSLFSTLKGKDFEVIVVDNASSDDSVEMVKKDFPKVQLVENKENVGFAKGINIGAGVAQGEYLLFLNSDTEVKNTILDLKNNLDTHTKAAVIGGLLVNNDGTPQRSYGKFYDLLAVANMLFRGDRGEIKKTTQIRQVDWVSGGFMLVRKKVFEELHGFDEHFFMYIEDMELCYRVKKAGYSVLFDPTVTVTHIGHGSSNRTFAVLQIYKGLLYFYKKHKSPLEYAILKSLLSIKAGGGIVLGTVTNNAYLVETYKKALKI